MSDLLDLVRTAEDEARLTLRKRTPAVPIALGEAPAEEDVVDVGDEAIDAPPSSPPMRAATPATSFARVAHRPADAEPARGLPPALAILLVLALPILALALVTR